MTLNINFRDGTGINTFSGVFIRPDSAVWELPPRIFKKRLQEVMESWHDAVDIDQLGRIYRDPKTKPEKWVTDGIEMDADLLGAVMRMEHNLLAGDDEKEYCRNVLAILQHQRANGKLARCANLSLRRLVLTRDGYKCRYCGTDLTNKTARMDHLIPYSLGGLTEFDNLATACLPCNSRKTGRTLDQADMKLLPIA